MTDFHKVPRLKNKQGELRKVGVEIEFGNLTLAQATECLVDFVASTCGQARKESGGRYDLKVHGDSAGHWQIELDYAYLKDLGRETPAHEWEKAFEKGLAWLAEHVVPIEIISPPLAMDKLPDIEILLSELRKLGAEGSSKEPHYAFGLQLNPELPELTSQCILRYFQAFLCLGEWLLEENDTDWSRKLTAFATPFPKNYEIKVLEKRYQPSMNDLIDDYLADNATRNRALDLLPLFKEIDKERVQHLADDGLIKARPTFHYRLPSCEIHDSNWGLHTVWNRWVMVEKLAEDSKLLSNACQEKSRYLSQGLYFNKQKWVTFVRESILPKLKA